MGHNVSWLFYARSTCHRIDIPGPQRRGTVGTLSLVEFSHRDRGHPPIDCDGYCALIRAAMCALMRGGGVVSTPLPMRSMALFARRAEDAEGSLRRKQAAPEDG